MKNNLIIAFAVLISSFTYAQQKTSSLAFMGGITEKKGLGFMGNYTYTSENANYEFAVLHSIFEEEEGENPLTFSNTTLNVGYLHSVIRNATNSISINIGGGISGGYESIPTSDDVVLVSESGFIAGVYGVLQADFYLSDTISILLRAQENYNVISTTGKANPFLALGIKFNL